MAADEKKKQEVSLLDNLWSFNYRKGQALLSGIVRARDEGTAFRVATAWCERNNCRPCARVTPMILADESILTLPPVAADEFPLPSPIEATTSVSA